METRIRHRRGHERKRSGSHPVYRLNVLTKTSTGQEALQGTIGKIPTNPRSGGELDPAMSAVQLCVTAVSGTMQLCVTAASVRAARGPRGQSYGFTRTSQGNVKEMSQGHQTGRPEPARPRVLIRHATRRPTQGRDGRGH